MPYLANRGTYMALMLCFMVFNSWAQIPDTTLLSPVEIKTHKPAWPEAYVLDSTTLVQTLGNTLDQNLALTAPFYIKNYGAGNISTGSFRGGNASQIAVVWNGVPLQNVNSGNVDFSLIPSLVADHVSFSEPDQNSSFGQVNLSSKPLFQKKTKLVLANQYALHDIMSQQLLLSKSNTHHDLRVSLSQKKGDNKYPFPDGQSIKQQQHASLYQKNATLDYSYALNSRLSLSLAYWGQNYTREVPPALHTISYAQQYDLFHRGMFKIAYRARNTTFNYQQALLKEQLQYIDPSKALNSAIGSVNWMHIAQIDRKVGTLLHTQLLIHNSRQSSQSGNYASDIVRNILWIKPSLTGDLKATHSKVGTFAKIEWVNRQTNPFQYGVYIQQQILKQVKMRVQAQKYLRNPTFNDLYWKDWGNPTLRPEYGAVYDMELSYGQTVKNLSHHAQFTVYSKNIKDWIIWLPINASLWHALNARQVWARGFEIRENVGFKRGALQCQVSGYYSYVKSTYEKYNVGSSEDILHKQLIYVPPHQASITGTLSYKSVLVRFSQHYTSWRFTSSDNEEFLDSYQLSALYLHFKILNIDKNTLSADCQIDNLFNKRIETVANMPMPLRTFKLGIIYQLN